MRLLDKEFDDKTQKLHVDQKIAISAKTNEVRLHKMSYRNKKLDVLRQDAMAKLVEKIQTDTEAYKEVMKDLIVQGMIKMLEEEIELLVKEGDQDFISEMLEECQAKYSQILQDATGREYNCKLSIIEERFMTKEQGADAGGIILCAHGRRITVQNTLADRLTLLFDNELPTIRRVLFPPAQQ